MYRYVTVYMNVVVIHYCTVHYIYVVVRLWESIMRCMVECYFPTVLQLLCSVLRAFRENSGFDIVKKVFPRDLMQQGLVDD